MNKRLKNFLLILTLLTGSYCSQNKVSKAKEDRPPNVIVVLTDDQGWGDFSYTQNKKLKTPAFDQMAKEGMVLERFYVSPVCATTRASLLTGRYHLRTGVSWVTRGRENMRTEEITVAEVFKEAGYATGLFGKWHNGAHYPFTPQGQGFETFFGFTSGHLTNYFDSPLTFDNEVVDTKGYITDVLTDTAIAFIDEHADQPFFAFIPYNAPHAPYQVPDLYYDQFKDVDYGYGKEQNKKIASVYAMCKNIDDNLARLIDHIEKKGLSENTIILYLTDNGPQGKRYNGPWRGQKTSVHEGGSLVPLAIQWKGHLPKGKVIKDLTAHIDLMPTLLSLAGVKPTADIAFDGIDLSGVLLGKEKMVQERQLYTHMAGFEVELEKGAVRDDQYRFVLENGTAGLFDLQNDPGETKNLVGQKPVRAAKMRRDYERWFQEVTQKGFDPLKIPIGYPQSPTTILAAHEGEPFGKVVYKANPNGWAHDWLVVQGVGGTTFPIEIVNDATYRLKLQYTADQQAVGTPVEISVGDQAHSVVIDTPFIPVSIPSPDRVLREQEAFEQTWGTLALGDWELKATAISQLKVKINPVNQARQNTGTIEIKGVIIEKIPINPKHP